MILIESQNCPQVSGAPVNGGGGGKQMQQLWLHKTLIHLREVVKEPQRLKEDALKPNPGSPIHLLFGLVSCNPSWVLIFFTSNRVGLAWKVKR